jgi:pyridoxamine 5'-phosphate oxidase family protein
LAYLNSQRVGRLATVQPNGTIQVSPVGFYYNARFHPIDIGGSGMADSQKYRNVLANGKVALVVDDMPSTSPLRARYEPATSPLRARYECATSALP